MMRHGDIATFSIQYSKPGRVKDFYFLAPAAGEDVDGVLPVNARDGPVQGDHCAVSLGRA